MAGRGNGGDPRGHARCPPNPTGGAVIEYVGIDFHKRQSLVARVKAGRNVLSQGKVSNERPALTRFLRSLEPGTKLAPEATEHWVYLYEVLEDRQVDLVLTHPLKTKAIASARTKTDKLDATTLAQLPQGNLLPVAYIPPPPIRDLRELLRYWASLAVLRGLLKNKLQAVLLKHGLVYPRRNVLSHRAQPWGGRCTSARALGGRWSAPWRRSSNWPPLRRCELLMPPPTRPPNS